MIRFGSRVCGDSGSVVHRLASNADSIRKSAAAPVGEIHYIPIPGGIADRPTLPQFGLIRHVQLLERRIGILRSSGAPQLSARPQETEVCAQVSGVLC